MDLIKEITKMQEENATLKNKVEQLEKELTNSSKGLNKANQKKAMTAFSKIEAFKELLIETGILEIEEEQKISMDQATEQNENATNLMSEYGQKEDEIAEALETKELFTREQIQDKLKGTSVILNNKLMVKGIPVADKIGNNEFEVYPEFIEKMHEKIETVVVETGQNDFENEVEEEQANDILDFVDSTIENEDPKEDTFDLDSVGVL